MEILWFYISPGEIDFWGGVIGGVVSTIGAIAVAVIAALLAQKHENRKQEHEKLTLYSRACFQAELDLNNQITMMQGNLRLLEKCTELINTGGIMVNLPREIPFNNEVIADFRNQELVNKWLRLRMQVTMVNNLVADYRKYYIRTTEEIHMMLLRGEQPNAKTAKEDFKTLHDYGNSAIKATNTCLEMVTDVYALVAVHANRGNDKKTQFKSFKQVNEFKAPADEVDTERAEVLSRFKPEDMFLDMN